MDEVLVNANELENSPDSTTTALRKTAVPFSIDPMLTRFQFPGSLQNEKGETKRNFRRLAAEYAEGTGVPIGSGPLVDMVTTDESWRPLPATSSPTSGTASSKSRSAKLELFSFDQPQELRPARSSGAGACFPNNDRGPHRPCARRGERRGCSGSSRRSRGRAREAPTRAAQLGAARFRRAF